MRWSARDRATRSRRSSRRGWTTMRTPEMQPPTLTQRPAWKALEAHYETIRQRTLRQLFADDPLRGERLTAEAAGLYLAEQCGLRARIAAMFSGEKINVTEDRAALHVALRAPEGERIFVDGVDV